MSSLKPPSSRKLFLSEAMDDYPGFMPYEFQMAKAPDQVRRDDK